MKIDRMLGARPEGARRSSSANLANYRRLFHRSTPQRSVEQTDSELDALVDGAMAATLASEARADGTFGDYARLFGFCRSAVMQEGRLLEVAIAHATKANPNLKLFPVKPMPIVPAACEMLKRTAAEDVKGVRFPARVQTAESYSPDLFVINRARHSGLILDVKRNLSAHRPNDIDRLRFRMLAAASIASEWVAENQGPMLVEIETAIVDGADEVSDHERGVFRLSELDELLETPGATATIQRFRDGFSRRVKDELSRRCRALVSADRESPDACQAGEQDGEADSSAIVPLMPSERQLGRFGYARRPALN